MHRGGEAGRRRFGIGVSGRPMGLIAGGGRLPSLVAEGMRASGAVVCCVAFHGQYDAQLPEACDHFAEVGLARPGQWARTLRKWGVTQATMVGRVDKASHMHDPWRLFRRLPDWRAVRIWYRRLRHDKRSGALLAAVAEELADCGIELIDTTVHIPEHLAVPGVMTRRAPTAQQSSDVAFGWPLLVEALRLDIGQSMAVSELDVVAVEAVEGTDRMIERAGQLCRRKGWTLLKGARPDHDRRADVPTIGENTIRALHRAGGGCVALGVGDVIILDRAKTLALADELGVAVLGMERAAATAAR